MKPTPEQQIELKKIEAAFDALRELSESEEKPLDALTPDLEAPNVYDLRRNDITQQTLSRQEAFEMLKKMQVPPATTTDQQTKDLTGDSGT